jgi:hypothetical protein
VKAETALSRLTADYGRLCQLRGEQEAAEVAKDKGWREALERSGQSEESLFEQITQTVN